MNMNFHAHAHDRSKAMAVMPDLNWSPATSADAEHEDEETDLDGMGSPGGASWAAVIRDHEGSPWGWEVYAHWLWEDIDSDPDGILAYGGARTKDDAKAAVRTWVSQYEITPDPEIQPARDALMPLACGSCGAETGHDGEPDHFEGCPDYDDSTLAKEDARNAWQHDGDPDYDTGSLAKEDARNLWQEGS